jgi:hypothetical protein
MSDRTDARQQADASRGEGGGEGTPLADFPWSDDIVGMGFFPDEVALPAGWSWSSRRVR